MFFLLKASDAAPKMATSVAPAASAASKPLRLGVSTGYDTPFARLMCFMTSALSPICAGLRLARRAGTGAMR